MSLFGTVYDFSVDHNSIKKEDILNIHKYLMVKTNTKIMIGFLKIIFIGWLPSIVNAFNHTKYVSISNQKCTSQPTLINLHLNDYAQGLQ